MMVQVQGSHAFDAKRVDPVAIEKARSISLDPRTMPRAQLFSQLMLKINVPKRAG